MVTAVPAHADSVDPVAAAQQFFDLANGERAAAGVPALQWRDDVAGMAVAQSAAMAQAGTIWHGSFVSPGNLTALNANLLAENVGMGGDVMSVHNAFMNSPHHRENILDSGLNEVGVGVVIAGDGSVYVTEDFLHSKSVNPPKAAAAAPAPAAPRAAAKPVAPRPATPRVAATAPAHAAAPSAPVTTVPPVVPVTVPAPVGVVNAVPFAPTPAALNAAPGGVLTDVFDGGAAFWMSMFGVLLLVAGLCGFPRLSAMHKARDQHRQAT